MKASEGLVSHNVQTGTTMAARGYPNGHTESRLAADEWEEDLLTSLHALTEEKLSSDDFLSAEKYAKSLLARSNRHGSDVGLLKMLARAASRKGGCNSLADDVAVQMSRSSGDLGAITYLLAEIYLINSELDTACDFCKQSMKIRRAELGKSADDTIKAVALLIEILRRRSKEFDREHADAFERLLPNGYHHMMLLGRDYNIAPPLSGILTPSSGRSASPIMRPMMHNSMAAPHAHHNSTDAPTYLPPPPAVHEASGRPSVDIPSYEAATSEIQAEAAQEARAVLTTRSESDSDDTVSPVFPAIMRNREDLTERLISKQRLINVRTADHNRSLLHVSAREGLRLTSRKLLEKGCEPNGRDEWGFTPLHYAAANGNWLVVDMLLKEGGDPGATGYCRGQVTAADVVDSKVRVASEEGERRTSAGERWRLEELVRRHAHGHRVGRGHGLRDEGSSSTGSQLLTYTGMALISGGGVVRVHN